MFKKIANFILVFLLPIYMFAEVKSVPLDLNKATISTHQDHVVEIGWSPGINPNDFVNVGGAGLSASTIAFGRQGGRLQKITVDYLSKPVLYWYRNRYAEIRVYDKDETSFSIVVDFQNMTHTYELRNFYGLDPTRNLVAFQVIDINWPNSPPYSKAYQILVTGLYDHSKGLFIPFPKDHGFDYEIDNGKTNFDTQGNLVLTYLTAFNDKMKTIVFPIDPNKFQPINPNDFNKMMDLSFMTGNFPG